MKPRTIVVDPGHGGRDPGATVGRHREKDYTLAFSLTLAGELRARGHRVLLTRTQDVDLAPLEPNWRIGKGIDLRARSDLANREKANLFISMHCNYSTNSRTNGAWILYSKGSVEGQRLSALVFKRLAKIAGVTDADPEAEVYPDDSGWTGGRTLSVLRRTSMTAILVELGFMSNVLPKGDLEDLQRADMPMRIARGIADGVEEWFRLKYGE